MLEVVFELVVSELCVGVYLVCVFSIVVDEIGGLVVVVLCVVVVWV